MARYLEGPPGRFSYADNLRAPVVYRDRPSDNRANRDVYSNQISGLKGEIYANRFVQLSGHNNLRYRRWDNGLLHLASGEIG